MDSNRDIHLRSARENLMRRLTTIRVLGVWDKMTIDPKGLLEELEHLIDVKIDNALKDKGN